MTNQLTELTQLSKVLGGYSSKVVKSNNNDTDMEILMNCVCDTFGVTPEQIRSPSRVSYFVYPRHVFNYIAVNEKLGSLKAIGSFIGGRDHTTIIHSHKEAAPSILLDRRVNEKYHEVLANFQEITYFRNYGLCNG